MGKYQEGQFGNSADRSKSRANPILASVEKEFGGELEYWEHIAKAARGGDKNCLNLLAARLRPPFKARSVCVEFDIKGDNAKDYVSGVISAVAGGRLPPDEATSLLNAILAGDKLEKLEELEQRVNQMVERQNGYS